MKTLDGGTFHCPNEGADHQYHRREARRWFTVFWIPLIPLKVLGVFVECDSCGAQYDEKVLSLPTNADIEDQLTRALRHVTVAMIQADGNIDEAELQAGVQVVNMFGFHGYDRSDLQHDLATLQVDDLEHELAQVAAVLTPQGQERVVASCIHLAAADGDVDQSELQMLTHAARSLGMTAAHVKGVLADVLANREAS